jgi:hypothetical protein
MLIDFVQKEIAGLKAKQATVAGQLQEAQKELQRLTETQLVISGALQALTHVAAEHQKEEAKTGYKTLPPIPEAEEQEEFTEG